MINKDLQYLLDQDMLATDTVYVQALGHDFTIPVTDVNGGTLTANSEDSLWACDVSSLLALVDGDTEIYVNLPELGIESANIVDAYAEGDGPSEYGANDAVSYVVILVEV